MKVRGLQRDAGRPYRAPTEEPDQVHEEGKRILVWTVNDEAEQRAFMEEGADGIITDEVEQAIRLTAETNTRPLGAFFEMFQ